MKTIHPLMKLADLWSGEMKRVIVQGIPLLLINYNHRIYAYDDRCPHKGVSLAGGELEETQLTCPAHHWKFNIVTGQGINPSNCKLKHYPITIENGDICLVLDDEKRVAQKVGPILQSNESGKALAQAIINLNPLAKVIDRESYLRLESPDYCFLTKDSLLTQLAIGESDGLNFVIFLESAMVSFVGELELREDIAQWRAQGIHRGESNGTKN